MFEVTYENPKWLLDMIETYLNGTKTLNSEIDGKELDAMKNIWPILGKVETLLRITQGAIHLEFCDIHEFIQDAKKIKWQSCLIALPKETSRRKIIAELRNLFDKTQIKIETDAPKRIIGIEGNISLETAGLICEIMSNVKNEPEMLWGFNPNPSDPKSVKVTLFDIYK